MIEEGAFPSESEGPMCEEKAVTPVEDSTGLESLAGHSKEVEASVSENQDARIERNPVAEVVGTYEVDIGPEKGIPAECPSGSSTSDNVGKVERLEPPAVVQVEMSKAGEDHRMEKKPVIEGHSAEPQDAVEGGEDVSRHDQAPGADDEPVDKGKAHVADGDGTRGYSDEEFGKILQISQWSLTHRIQVCKALESPTEHWRMSPLSRHEYPKQSLALINSPTQISAVSSLLSSWQWSDTVDWKSRMQELEEEVKGLIYQDWKSLTIQLEAELKTLRENDEKKEWYTAFEGKSFLPGDIYIAVEEGREGDFKMMMRAVGHQHWGYSSPGEYRGATPLHWAALHGQLNMVEFIRTEWGNDWYDTINEARDEFGFSPFHMAIFPSSWPVFVKERLPEDVDNLRVQTAQRCSRMFETLDQMPSISRSNSSSISNFIIFYMEWDMFGERACFIAKLYFSSPMHPIQLAVCIAHPLVVETLMAKFKNEAFNVVSRDGDTILHLAARNKQYGTVMTVLLRYLHFSPATLNSCNKDGQTPLHIAVFQGNCECVAALLRCHYIEMNIENKNGYTALQIATQCDILSWDVDVLWSRRMFARTLGREDIEGERFGISSFKYNDNFTNISLADEVGDSKVCSRLIEDLDPEILRHRQILQISQWSRRHRILALRIFEENAAQLVKIEGIYKEQCLKLAKTLNLRGADIAELRTTLMDDVWMRREYCILRKIFKLVEEGDLKEFKKFMMGELEIGQWSINLDEYGGATPLHWAALHGRKEMVSLIHTELAPFRKEPTESDENAVWSQTVNARDNFGFTPLHLAVFSSLRRLDHTEGNEVVQHAKLDREAENCSELIEELYQMGVPHCASSSSQSDFIAWNLSERIYSGADLSNTELYPIHLGVWFAHPRVVEKLLERCPEEAFVKTNASGDTILHDAAAWEALIKHCSTDQLGRIETVLLKQLDSSLKVVNTRRNNRETPLHCAVRTESTRWAKVLLQCVHINFNLRDREMRTPRELASNMRNERKGAPSSMKVDDPVAKIIGLIDCFDVESLPRVTEALQRERQVYVDAANAILVGAALIASASFGAWLQPPLGYTPYYSPEFLDTNIDAAPGTYESFVAIKQYWIIHLFWVFNSLSFFFSLATVIAGADAALPREGLQSLEDRVTTVRKAVKWASWMLSLAIVFVIGTFTTVGFAILPPIQKYRINMYCTLFIGLMVCGFVLLRFLRKLSPGRSPATKAH